MICLYGISRELANGGEGIQFKFTQPAFTPFVSPASVMRLLLLSRQVFERSAARIGLTLSLAFRFSLGITSG